MAGLDSCPEPLDNNREMNRFSRHPLSSGQVALEYALGIAFVFALAMSFYLFTERDDTRNEPSVFYKMFKATEATMVRPYP